MIINQIYTIETVGEYMCIRLGSLDGFDGY